MKIATTFPVILGQVVIGRRKALNLTQGDLAAALGLQASSMSRLERGVAMFSVPQLRRVATTLGTTFTSLVGEAEKAADVMKRKGVTVLEEDPPGPEKIWTMVASKEIEQVVAHVARHALVVTWNPRPKEKEQVKVYLRRR